MKTIGNILWFLLCGVWLGISYVLAGVLACITLIGIPFGLKNFSMAKLAMFPFDYSVVRKGEPGPNEAPLSSDD